MEHPATELADERAHATRGSQQPRTLALIGRSQPEQPTDPAPWVLPVGGDPAVGALLASHEAPDAGRRVHNLPHALTGFVGRERELADARRLLARTRLLTLTGTGGVGKSRLGQEAAARLLDTFADGVWLVELAALSDPTLVQRAVATTLGVREIPGRSLLESIEEQLRSQQILLLLDNCEHLIEACAEIADRLLRACPELQILATSREPLGISGEALFPVATLALPDRQPDAARAGYRSDRPGQRGACMSPAPRELDPTTQPDAVQLFVVRAQAVLPSFVLTDRNLAAVEEICLRLDGIPLAIELAAARVAMLGPDQIAERLGDRLRFLGGGSRTVLPRYRTLRALLDWSHDLLDEQAQALFRRLAVFVGGWTLEAAESVCGGQGIERHDVLDVLSGLVARSLVLPIGQDDEPRYRLLETLREYAAEKLAESGEQARLRERHAAWFLTVVERVEPELSGPRQVAGLRELDREHDNLRAALAWSVDGGDPEDGVRLAVALFRFWSIRSCFSEGDHWLREILGRATEPPSSDAAARARVRALQAASRMVAKLGDHQTARAYLETSLTLAGDHHDRPGLAAGAHSLGCLARVRGEYPEAHTLLREARARFQELDDRLGVAETSVCLGVVASWRGDFQAARALVEQALTLYRELDNRQGISVALNNLGEIALEMGDLTTARALEIESLSLALETGDCERTAIALAALAGIAAAERVPARALTLGAAAMAIRERLGKSSPAAWRARFDRWLEPARQVLSPTDRVSAWAAGEALSMEQAVELGLSAADPRGEPVATLPGRRQIVPIRELVPRAASPSPAVAALTRREQEVAALIAQGMTNRQIAEALVITEGTAANHVKHILARLVLDSRVQIATWAIDRGLMAGSAIDRWVTERS